MVCYYCSVVQLVERRTVTAKVTGPSPVRAVVGHYLGLLGKSLKKQGKYTEISINRFLLTSLVVPLKLLQI